MPDVPIMCRVFSICGYSGLICVHLCACQMLCVYCYVPPGACVLTCVSACVCSFRRYQFRSVTLVIWCWELAAVMCTQLRDWVCLWFLVRGYRLFIHSSILAFLLPACWTLLDDPKKVRIRINMFKYNCCHSVSQYSLVLYLVYFGLQPNVYQRLNEVDIMWLSGYIDRLWWKMEVKWTG